MINARKTVLDQGFEKKEGRETERIALLLCILFLSIYLSQELLFHKADTPVKSQLTILPDANLQLSVLSDSRNSKNPGGSLLTDSPENYSLAPFFFHPIPVNYCNKTSLLSIAGVGPVLAENILQTRDRLGVFLRPEDLLQVQGIGLQRMERLRTSLSFSYDHEDK